MWRQKILGTFVLGCIVVTSPVTGLWSCSEDVECRSLSGGVCRDGDCVCPPGKQSVQGGSVCVDLAPYYLSSCVEDHQCSRMTLAYECRRTSDEIQTGMCVCQPNHHYFLGRCWPTVDYGSNCTRSEECLSNVRDPFSLTCDGTCRCSEGYYERQRGECRRIANAVGDGCVHDSDCQFEGGACDVNNFACYNINTGEAKSPSMSPAKNTSTTMSAISRQHTTECIDTSCTAPFVCSNFGVCVCPVGYYLSDNGNNCLAELGSPSTAAQCTGLLARVIDGICTCPPNFAFEENMRDCVRPTRRITDSCAVDRNCHTFGVETECGEAQPPWGLRTCQCIEGRATWDDTLQICRLFARIGEQCEVNDDCRVGELEIQCVKNDEGQGFCTCPEGFQAVGELCLTTGLVLGDTCQATQECTGTNNTVCENNRCSCDRNTHQETEDGICAPIIGGICEQDSDCVIENTLCMNSTNGESQTCQCDADFIVYDDECWPIISSIDTPCNVSAQCQQLLGEASSCAEDQCLCDDAHHYRDGGCWPVTGLFETCSRTSQCFLSDSSERTVCRNSICQCDFKHPYNEELHTCTSAAPRAMASLLLLAVRFALTKVL